MDICQIGYDICEFDSLRGLGIDVIGRVHFDYRDRFAIWMGSIGDQTMSTNEWLLTSDFWQFIEPWHGGWYEYEIFIASCTDNIYDLENERWLLGDMIDHVGIYGSRVAEGLSAFNVSLVGFVVPYIRDLMVPWFMTSTYGMCKSVKHMSWCQGYVTHMFMIQ